MSQTWLHQNATVYVLNEQGTNRFTATIQGDIPDAERAELARRIVACVNACAGIPTEDLEAAAAKPESYERFDHLRDATTALGYRAFIEFARELRRQSQVRVEL